MGNTGSTQVSTSLIPFPRSDLKEEMEKCGFKFGEKDEAYIGVSFPDGWTLKEGKKQDFDRWTFYLIDSKQEPRFATWEVYKVGGYDPPTVSISRCNEEARDNIKLSLLENPEKHNAEVNKRNPEHQLLDALCKNNNKK